RPPLSAGGRTFARAGRSPSPMHQDPHPRRPWRVALAVLAASAAALALVAALALGVGIRDELARAGDPLAAEADRVAARIDPARPGPARRALQEAGVPARLIGPGG